MIKLNCKTCNKEFLGDPYKVKIGKGKFCSHSCSAKYRTGKLNPFYGKKHTEEWKKQQSKRQLGEKSILWKGGRRKDKKNYWHIYMPEHPNSVDVYIPEHRYMAECYLGRFLSSEEEVHHIDENVENNLPENLYLFPSTGYHMNFHRWSKNKIKLKSNLTNFS